MAKIFPHLSKSLSVFTLFLLLSLSQSIHAQGMPVPERDQLLNGLRILFLPIPGSPNVTLKLRIHSGAAFDLAGKAGEMALLGDLLFPDQATRDYFNSELGGRLDVSVGYDSTTVTMVGKASELENIVEVLRNGLLATQLTPEIVAKMRDVRIKILRETSVSPAFVADRAISARLFGDFPYGRLAAGSPEDLVRVERGDLMLARDRFLNSNNATLAVIGGVTKSRTMRTLRQLLGPWRKSEALVPTTFRQAKAPDPRALIVTAPTETAEVRLAIRGISRSDSDFNAATILARVAQYRWIAALPEMEHKPTFVRSDTYTLPGQFVMGTALDATKTTDAIAAARKVLDSFAATPPTESELDRAKRGIIAERKQITPEALADNWLDMDTYHLRSAEDPMIALERVTSSDVQRAANRLFKDAPIATVVVGEAGQLRSALQGKVPFEVFGEVASPAQGQKTPGKPGSE